MSYSLCCISNTLKEQGHSFKSMTWKRFGQLSEDSVDDALFELGSRWLNNVKVTSLIIQNCAENGWGYRVSSSLFSCLTHPEFGYSVEDVPQYEDIIKEFDHVASNDAWGVRLSCHPDQFNVLASENESSVEKTINELNYHGWLMDKLGTERSYANPINIHVNNSRGDLSSIAARFMSNLERCDHSVRSRLVVENEDKGCWNVCNLYHYFYKPYKIPITHDNLHDECNPSPSMYCTMDECADTWGDFKPLFHYSESHPDKPNPRSHADMPVGTPDAPKLYDYEIELKGKCYAIRELERLAYS